MRPLFQAAAERLDVFYGDSEQAIFTHLFAEQERARQAVALRNEARRAAAEHAAEHDAAAPIGARQDWGGGQPGEDYADFSRFEFGIGLDYEGIISQPSSMVIELQHAHPQAQQPQQQQKQQQQQKPKLPHHPKRDADPGQNHADEEKGEEEVMHWRVYEQSGRFPLPSEIANSTPPFWTADYATPHSSSSSSDLPPGDTPWSQAALLTNAVTDVSPAVALHAARHRRHPGHLQPLGPNKPPAWGAGGPWFVPHLRALLATKARAYRMPVAVLRKPVAVDEETREKKEKEKEERRKKKAKWLGKGGKQEEKEKKEGEEEAEEPYTLEDYWGPIDERGGMRIENGAPPGEWRSWDDESVCGRAEVADEVLADGRGGWVNPAYYLHWDFQQEGFDRWREMYGMPDYSQPYG
ncbi:hypothetical protein GGR56DRAFT_643651 [Xylariaceae sp. FL0804]|nr:hypothetical protein GGR56DRAFT_643651 [Xylariaceae sp. FL0804]